MIEAVRHNFQLLLNEEAADCGFDESLLDDRRRGSVRAVRRTKRVVHIDIAVRSELFAEFGVSALFTRVETKVFEQNALALFERRDLLFRIGADHVGSEGNFIVQQLVEPVRNGLEGELLRVALRLFDIFGSCLFLLFGGESLDRLFLLFVELDLLVKDVVRLAHVRAKHDFCIVFHQVFDGGKRTHDTVFVGDLSVLHRNVEIHAYENALAVYVDIGDRLFIHTVISFAEFFFLYYDTLFYAFCQFIGGLFL